MNTKTPIYLTAFCMFFFAGAAWTNYESLPPHVWNGMVWLFGLMLFTFVANHWLNARALKHAVQLEIRPNRVVVDGVELQIPFSSESRLFSGKASMEALIGRVEDQVQSTQTGWISWRPSVQASIAPEGLHLTEPDLDALGEMLGVIFMYPSLQIIGQSSTGEPLAVTRAF